MSAENDFLCEANPSIPTDPDPVAYCQTCLRPAGDINRSKVTNVADTQCEILENLYELGGQIGSPPACTAVDVPAPLTLTRANVDLNCDGKVTVSDVQISISLALKAPLSPLLDINGDGCVDACLIDFDSDGVSNAIDCAPFDPSISTEGVSSFEFCDGYDNNCNGIVDEDAGPLGDHYSCDDGSFCSGTEVCTSRPSGTPGAQGPMMTEVMLNAAPGVTHGQFIELFNPTNAPIDLRTWRLRRTFNGVTLQVHTVNAPAPVLLLPGGFVVLAQTDNAGLNGGVIADYLVADFVLAGNEGTLELLNPSNAVVDSVSYDGTWPTGAGVGGASMELIPPFIKADNSDYKDNSLKANWRAALHPWRPVTQIPDPANPGSFLLIEASANGSPGGIFTAADVPGVAVKLGGVPAPGYARVDGESSGPRCTSPADPTCAAGAPELGGQVIAGCQIAECYDAGQALPPGHPAGAIAPAGGCYLRPNPNPAAFNDGRGCNDFFACTADACDPGAPAGTAYVDGFGCAHTPIAGTCTAPGGMDAQCVSAFCPADPAGFDMGAIATGVNLVDGDSIDRDTQGQTVEVSGCVVDIKVELACSDGNFCTSGETCGQGAQCDYFGPDPGASPAVTTPAEADAACDDGLSCTGAVADQPSSLDACDPGTGACLQVVKDGTCKIETAPASAVFECFATGESPSAAFNLGRNTPCFVCNPAMASGSWTSTTAACNADDSGCTSGDLCVMGTCTPGTQPPANCNPTANGGLGSDALACTSDACIDGTSDDWNSSTLSGAGTAYTCDNYLIPGTTDAGTATPSLAGGTCLIDGVCYTAGSSPAGATVGGTDNNATCHICDAFGITAQSAGRYAWSPNTGAVCSDGFACSILDACTGELGECLGQTFDAICNDGNPCTEDRCDPYDQLPALLYPLSSGDPAYPSTPFSGCTFGAKGHDGASFEAVACSDGDACTFGELCADPTAGGTGAAGTTSPAPGLCARGTAVDCNDSNDCTYNFCVDGACKSAPIPFYFDGEFGGNIPRPLGETASSPPDPAYGYLVSTAAPYSVTNPLAAGDNQRRCDLTNFCTAGVCNGAGFCIVSDDSDKCAVGASNAPPGWDPVDGNACTLPMCDPAGATAGHVQGCYHSPQTSGPCDASELDVCDDTAQSTCQANGTCSVVPKVCAAPTPANDIEAVNQQCVTYTCNEALGSTQSNQCIAVANDNTTGGFVPSGPYTCDDGNSCTVDACQSDGDVGAFCERTPDGDMPPLDPEQHAACVHKEECHAILGWNVSAVRLARVDNPASGVAQYGAELLGNLDPQLDAATSAAVATAASNAALYADDLSNVPLANVLACEESPNDPCTGPDICQASGACLTGTDGDGIVTVDDYCESPIANALCVLTGAAGEEVRCPIRVAASSEAELLADALGYTLQLTLYYNASRVNLLHAQDRPCIPAAGFCLPEGTNLTLHAPTPDGSGGIVFPYGHQASFYPDAGANTAGLGATPNYLSGWDTFSDFKVVNTEDPTDTAGGSGSFLLVNAGEPSALNRAYFSPPFDPDASELAHIADDAPIGSTGSLDPEAPTLFELVFVLQQDVYPNDPVLIHASEVVVTREDATLLGTRVWKGVIVTSAGGSAPVACSSQGAACDDGNSCTVNDTCTASLVCTGTAVADGSTCDDGELCTFGDTCQDGSCVSGAYFEGAECFDGAQCTFGEYCEAGVCVSMLPEQFFCGACDPLNASAEPEDACGVVPNAGPEHLACAFAGASGDEFDCWLYTGANASTSAAVVGLEYRLAFDADQLTLLHVYDKGVGSETTPLSFVDQGGYVSTNFASMSSAIIPGLPFDVPANRHSLFMAPHPDGLGASGNPMGAPSTELHISILPTVVDSGSGAGGGTIEMEAPLTNAYVTGFEPNGEPIFSLNALPGSNASSGNPESHPGAYLRLRFRLDVDVSNDAPATVVYTTDDPFVAGDGDGIVALDAVATPLPYSLENRVVITSF